ncbi:VCBS repeat-containing protein [candidate division WOR-3 bacterium]|nr:VCBS repeat-containing protein [candidate division WOR-3 bacterium]
MSYPVEARVSTGLSFADINGDGNCEVLSQIMYTEDKIGTLFVYDHQANRLWTFSNDTIVWLPAFGDLDDDNIDEVIVGTSKGLYAFDGDGSLMPDFPISYPGCYCIEVSIADVNLDDSLDIIYFVDWDGDSVRLYVSDKHGQALPGWPITTPEYFYTHPAVADIDNDGYKEILYNTWADSLHCYRYDGSRQPGFPVPCLLTPECGPSEIILCDLDHDNYLEILIGSCTAWADTGCLYIYRHDGSMQPGWPVYFSENIVFHPDQYHFAVGDLNNDQDIEILITGTGSGLRILDRNGHYLPGSGQRYSWGAMNPVIANIDFTPEKEFVVQSGNGRTSAFYYNGELCKGWPIQSQGHVNYWNSITIDDIDNDGIIELGIVAGATGKILHVWDLHGSPVDIEWGRPYFDLQRTCHYR